MTMRTTINKMSIRVLSFRRKLTISRYSIAAPKCDRNCSVSVQPSYSSEPENSPEQFKNATTTTSCLFPRNIHAQLKDSEVGYSYELLVKKGFLRKQSSGLYHLLPLGYRVLEKIKTLIDTHLQEIGAVKMTMPILSPQSLWNKSGRWDNISEELLKVQDRTKKIYCLGPTHEESVTSLVRELLISRRQLPLRLYQLDRKFRDELRPRFGLMRAKEFWMKDMYTFDESQEKAMETYEEVVDCYKRIFLALDLPFVKAEADTGDIGGSHSHEFLIPSSAGEGKVISCSTCGTCTSQTIDTSTLVQNCSTTGSCVLDEFHGIEVAHTFYLGTTYSKSFDLHFPNAHGKNTLVQMGCYGIGVSRILSTLVELGHKDGCFAWPTSVAPFLVCIVANNKDDLGHPILTYAREIYDVIQSAFPGDVIVDDRSNLFFGSKLRDVKTYGYPVTIILGSKTNEGFVEIESPQLDNNQIIHTSELISTIKSLCKL